MYDLLTKIMSQYFQDGKLKIDNSYVPQFLQNPPDRQEMVGCNNSEIEMKQASDIMDAKVRNLEK